MPHMSAMTGRNLHTHYVMIYSVLAFLADEQV